MIELDADDVADMREMLADGEHPQLLADAYGIPLPLVARILAGRQSPPRERS